MFRLEHLFGFRYLLCPQLKCFLFTVSEFQFSVFSKGSANTLSRISVFSFDRFEDDLGILEIEGEAIVFEKVAAEDAGLFEAGRFVDYVEIESDGHDARAGVRAEGDLGKHER